MNYLRQNRLKEKAGEMALGVQLRSASERVAELIAMIGFDFLYIETEHFFCDDFTIEHIFRAVNAWNCTPIVRLCEGGTDRIGQLFDAGAGGVILPRVETGEQAREFVRAAKYPPFGNRSSTTCRCGHYGLLSREEVFQWGNAETLAIAMIETQKGIENLEDILNTGIDMIRIGFSDLAQDMGYPGQTRHPEVLRQAQQAIQTAMRHGIAVGAAATDKSDLNRLRSMGFTHFTVGSDLAILQKRLSGIKTIFGEERGTKP